MKRKTLVISAVLVFALSITACSGKPANTDAKPSSDAKPSISSEQQPPSDSSAASQATAGAEGDAQNTQSSQEPSDSEGVLTGTVDENKGFMITVTSDEDSELYVFSLDENQSELYKDLKTGDKVSVAYTNGLPSPDNLETIVTDIQKK